MPRGNDSRAAAAEFRGQYGVMGNAEDLIEANRAAYDAELRTASLRNRNDEATKALDLDAVDKKVEGGTVLDAAVRGDRIVAVVETESGHTYKQVLPAQGLVEGARKPRSIEEDDTTAIAQQSQASKLILAEAQAKAEQIIQDAIAKAHEEAAKIAAKARDEANDAADDGDDDKPKRGRGAQSGGASEQDKATAKEQQGKSDDTGKSDNPTESAKQ
jgi:hypothetical protein